MAERRRGKKRQQEVLDNPSREKKAVAKYLRFNLPTKEGKLVGMPVQYFYASDAVNCLLASKWAKKGKADPLFTNRASCVDYCHSLLLHGMFHRAARQERKRDKDRDKKKKIKSKDDVDEGVKEEERKGRKEKKFKRKEEVVEKKEESDGEKEKSDDKKDKSKDAENDEKEEKKEEEKKKKRKEKKVKLEMVDHQVFKDGDEIYVWIFDPVPFKTFIIGLLLVLGAIGVCLFPLWPPEVRLGVYYISLTVAGCIGFLLSLCVVRVILFCLVWAVTFGKHHFWFLPNLNEDVGFFESFKPVYYHEYMSKGKNAKEADKDNNDGIESEEPKDAPNNKETNSPNTMDASFKDAQQEENGFKGELSGTETESENENGYEIVYADDFGQQHTDDDDREEKESKKDV